MAVSGTEQGETPQSLVTPAFAGFPPIAESGTKAALTTGMTTDRKIFDFPLRRGIMAEIEYPGIAKLVSRWFGTRRPCVRVALLGPKIPSEIVDFRGIFLFFVYCGAGFGGN